MTIPEAVLAHHTAILGKTGSGKTSTSKLAVEQVVDAGFRVCVLDPIKSDWWGITSSADGRRPGLPFRILGGPRGHVPLHASAGAVIGQLVGSGQLPHSIIDMADFEAGGLQRFFVDFAPALLKHARGVVYLVVEEAHEFAPKERGGFGAENQAIHYAKKLATAGRSKGIRLIVATQRVQALHNAVLGSCETMIAHRLATPADQKPVMEWLKANADKATTDLVAGSLASLPTGTGWVCSGEARIFEQVSFPLFRTYDNTSTPTGDDDRDEVITAPVDHDELATLIGAAVQEAEANDPKALKAEIARLKAEATKGGGISQADVEEAKRASFLAGVEEGEKRGHVVGQSVMLARAQTALNGLRVDHAPDVAAAAAGPVATVPLPTHGQPRGNGAQRAVSPAPQPPQRQETPAPAPRQSEGDAIPRPIQKLIDAIAWWNSFGLATPTVNQVGFIAGYTPTAGTFNRYRSDARSRGLIDYPAGGLMLLTDEGREAARHPDARPTVEALHDAVRERLDGPLIKLLDPLLRAYPNQMSAADLGEASGYTATAGTFNRYRSSLRSLELIDYPASGQVRAADWLFP